MNSSKHYPLPWDSFVHMPKNDNKSILSFNEQKFAISICKLCISGFPCAGKTWSMLVIVIYAICRGLTISMIAMMVKRAIQVGRKYWRYVFGLPSGRIYFHIKYLNKQY